MSHESVSANVTKFWNALPAGLQRTTIGVLDAIEDDPALVEFSATARNAATALGNRPHYDGARLGLGLDLAPEP